MNYKLRWKATATAVAAAIALTACGGGGGGDAPASNTTPPTSGSTPTPANPAPTNPAPTNPAPTNPTPTNPTPTDPGAYDGVVPVVNNTIAREGLAWINYRRGQIGMPAVAESAQINTAAVGHSNYLGANRLMSHDQIAGRTAFTGANVADRLTAAGYTLPPAPNGYYGYGEVISGTTNTSGSFMVDELITAIYHRFVMFEPMFREVGTGAVTARGYSYFTADFAFRDAVGQGITKGSIVTWPYAGQVQVTRNFMSDSEDPDPVPDLNEVGYPVSVHTNLTSKLEVITFTMRPRGATTNLAVRRVDPLSYQNATDPTKRVLTATSIVPLAPLAAATTYDVFFIGTVDGVAVTREWSFTTQ